MRILPLVAMLVVALALPAIAEPAAASDGGACDVEDAHCIVQDASCDLYERLPPFIPYVCR